jgi:hypothetical protein
MKDNFDGRMDALNGFTMLRSKECAQHGVALGQPLEGAPQRLQVGIPWNGYSAGKVIGYSFRR